jgi:hypothetical protein
MSTRHEIETGWALDLGRIENDNKSCPPLQRDVPLPWELSIDEKSNDT